MSTSILIGGKRYFKPGVYGSPDASKVGGKQIAFANMGIVGAFPQLQSDTVYEILSPQALTAWDPTSLEFARLARLAFKPTKTGGGADKLFLVNCQTNTQAYLNLPTSAPLVDSLKLSSKLWGSKGNQVWVKVANNISAGQDITIALPGFPTENYVGLTSGNVIEFKLDTTICTDLAGANDTAKANILQASWKLHWTKRQPLAVGPALTAAWTPTVTAIASKLQAMTAAATAADITFAVTGTAMKNVIGPGTGTPFTGTITYVHTIAMQDGQYHDIVHSADGSTYIWSDITSVVNNALPASITDVKGWAVDTTLPTSTALTAFTTLAEAANYVNNLNNKGVYATIKNPKANQIPVAEFEEPSSDQDIKDTALNIKADVWAIVQALSASNIVVPSRPATSTRTPAVTTGKLLANGQEGAVTVATDYPDALSKLENTDVQRVVALNDTAGMGGYLDTHCYNAAVKFARERNAWVGAPAGTSLAVLRSTYVNPTNSRNVTLVADKIKISAVKAGDVAAWLDPKYFAVQCAAMQCALKPATALTEKSPDILDFSHAWTDGSDENAVIEAGICGLYRDNLGNPVVLRSVTTWVQDDNPAYSETSANDSVNTSIRDLRAHLKSLIGDSIDSNLSPGVLEAMASARLAFQVAQGWIRAFSDVTASLAVDTFSIDYVLDEIQPVNFIVVTPHVG